MNYEKINSGIDSCELCGLRNSVDVNRKFGPTYGYGGNSVIICGIAPSYKRGGSKYPLSKEQENATAKVLFRVLDEVSWPIEKTYFTNLLKCSIPGNREPNSDEVDTCFKTWFMQELFMVNPFAIVGLGKYTNKYLADAGIKDTWSVFSIEHFSYINRKMELYDDWKKRWANIRDIIKDSIKEYDIDYLR